ncbi:uncharacterized protein LOC127719351 [Mytilus californianus]|uniref:uncharacterized protein LOC127719351 n=1 Tax=Mytilus californianus TaxID=6549 RepID=UPI0022470845|nr:uncharacterized protein LOC127719351 [Mytilus californianus]
MAEGGCQGQDSQMKSCTMSSCPITIIPSTTTTTTTTTHAPVNVPLEWGQWSECSVTCGMGVIFRQKYCHDQSRRHCKGPVQHENKRCITDSCNQQEVRQQMQILEGHDAVLPCGIKKKPHNSIYWITPKGKKIDSHTVIKRVLVVDDKLLLRETQRREHGVYHCVSSDGQTSDVEIDVLWCGLELCQHGGNCVRTLARLEHGHRRFECVCTSGYSGMFCEEKMPLPFYLILLIILMSVLVLVIILAIVITYICHR